MKLHIPEQKIPAKGAIPNHPRKLKKWLANLPNADLGAMARQIYSAVRDLNRQTMPSKYRIENMEQLREPVRYIFNNLEKHFINRTLPLPERSQKIVNLNQSLLKEVSCGYKIIIFQAANGLDKKVDLKAQNIAILRAIRYMSELLLRASEIYEPYPVGSWHDIHQMYSYAEQRGFHNKTIADAENDQNKASIADYYKQVMLFSLARPSALRQSDSLRVYNKMAEWADLTKLGTEAQEHQINRLFCARIDHDSPPNYLSMKDCDGSYQIRTLDTSKLIDTLHKDIKSIQSKDGKLAVIDQLSAETLQVLTMSWGVCAKRRFSRADGSGCIQAVIGLVNAARQISGIVEADSGKNPDVIKPGKRSQLNISLETAPENVKSSDTTHNEANNKQRPFPEDTNHGLHNKSDLQWEIVNVSAGGYCLRWNSDTASRAQIGEVIALREKESDGSLVWRIGVIRWMQNIRDRGLEIGVQVLSLKVMYATAQRNNKPDEEPFECLMLPAIAPLKLPASVLLPAHAFRPGNKLKINIMDQEMVIQLDAVKDHTGSFTQFQYSSKDAVEMPGNGNKTSASNKDDFDEIWSSL